MFIENVIENLILLLLYKDIFFFEKNIKGIK